MRVDSSAAGPSRHTRWPDAVAYREAIQSPALVLTDPALQRARAAQNRQGLPLTYTGRFAAVFRLDEPSGESWALRCFTTASDPLDLPRATRYATLKRRLGSLPEHFVPFRYLERGIRIDAQFYPIVALGWSTGVSLGAWVESHRQDSRAILRLAESLERLLARLESAGIAHGDWQHDNLIIDDGGATIRLVDYDAVFVPELAGYPASERGHPNYQHPARSGQHFGIGLDRFACLAMGTALRALARQPGLWHRFGDGESLLFTAADYRDPSASPLFAALKAQAELDRDDVLAESLTRLIAACNDPDSLGCLPITGTETVPAPPLPPPNTSAVRPQQTAPHLSSASIPPEFTHLARLYAPEAIAAERRARGWLLLIDVVLILMYFLMMVLVFRSFTVWPLAIPFLQFGVLGVSQLTKNLPRYRLRNELDAEITRVDAEILLRKGHDDVGGQPLTSPRIHRYISDAMRSMPIDRVLRISGITLVTLDALRAAGFRTVHDLETTLLPASLPPAHATALKTWLHTERERLARVYALHNPDRHRSPAPVQEVEALIAQREVLAAQRARWPDTSLRAYWRWLLGRTP
jgi:hypothetical protein